ncbi:DNA alkylation response protein, partial [Salipiger sp. HF18]|nr:DNA alkylation response protein [Salipiger sp. HF18]
SALSAHQTRWPGLPDVAEARAFVERTALLLAAAALLRTVPAEIAEAFIDTRLLSPRGRTPGAIPAMDAGAVIDRLGPGG